MQHPTNLEQLSQGQSGEFSRSGPAWEDRPGKGILRGFFSTLGQSLFRPTVFFRRMRVRGGLLAPLVYAIVVGSLSIVTSVVWEMVLFPEGATFLPQAQVEGLVGFRSVLYGLTIILSPIIVTVFVFITAAVLHVCLLVLGGARHGFEASFRVVCYAQGAGAWNVVPLVGAVAEIFWRLTLLVVGLAQSHEIPSWKSVLAVLALVFVWVAVLVVAVIGLVVGGMP